MIDWPAFTNNLRRHYGSLARAGREIGICVDSLRKLNRGEIHEPKFTTGVRLIDAHLKATLDTRPLMS